MENSNIHIAFWGKEYGLVVRDTLMEAGYTLVEPESDQVDLLVVGFWGEIVQKDMLEKPKYGALNVHPSLLPKYRGPTPVPTTILNGDTETGITIIHMDEEIDHGPIVASAKFEIQNPHITTPELLQILWEMGANLLGETIPKWVAGEIVPQQQNHSKATFTQKLTREHGRIDWQKPVEYIERQVRAFTPWPGAFMFYKGKRVKLLKAHIEHKKLVIDELQMEGKKVMNMKEFTLGYPDFTIPSNNITV